MYIYIMCINVTNVGAETLSYLINNAYKLTSHNEENNIRSLTHSPRITSSFNYSKYKNIKNSLTIILHRKLKI